MKNKITHSISYKKSIKKRYINRKRKLEIKILAKKIILLISEKNSKEIIQLFNILQSLIYKAVNKRLYTKNYASRKIKKIHKKIKKIYT